MIIFLCMLCRCGGLGEAYNDLFTTVPLCVDSINGNDSNSGYGWTNTVKTIQRASQLAGSGGEIWVKNTYIAYNAETISNGNISIYGGFSGTESRREERNAETATAVSLAGSLTEPLFLISSNVLNLSFHDFAFKALNVSTYNIFKIEGSSAVSFESCTFTGNTVGSVIYVSSGSAADICGCIFSGNNASGVGGVLYADSSKVTVTGSTFLENYSNYGSAYGGVLYASSSTVTISDSTVTGNYTTGSSASGGVLCASSSTVTISGSMFSGNFTTGSGGSGGAMYFVFSNAVITKSTFSGNHADYSNADGGAFAATSSNVTISNSVFESNHAGGNGGAFDMNAGSGNILNVTGSKFIGNTSVAAGGLCYLLSATAAFKDSYIDSNTAVNYTGGICLDANVSLTVTGTSISNCTSQYQGSAIGNSNPTGNSVVINRSSIYNNSGEYGGICMNTLQMYNSLMYNNTGTSVAELYSESCTIYNCTIVNTSAAGVIVSLGLTSSKKVANSIIYGNGSMSFGSTPTVVNSYTNMPYSGYGFTVRSDLSSEFSSFSTGKLRLANGSTLVNAGNNSYIYGDYDLDGAARIKGGNVDVGAFELK